MAVQVERDISNIGLIKADIGLSVNEIVTIDQNEQRTTDLLFGTVMAKISATGHWVPYTDTTATDGSGLPRGIYMGDDIAAADLVAGNIDDCAVITGNVIVDEQLLVFDDDTVSKTDVIGAGTVQAKTVQDALVSEANIFIEETENISNYEN